VFVRDRYASSTQVWTVNVVWHLLSQTDGSQPVDAVSGFSIPDSVSRIEYPRRCRETNKVVQLAVLNDVFHPTNYIDSINYSIHCRVENRIRLSRILAEKIGDDYSPGNRWNFTSSYLLLPKMEYRTRVFAGFSQKILIYNQFSLRIFIACICF
jgi:hypothetical protein